MVKFTQRQYSGKIICLMCQENVLSKNHSQGKVIIVNASIIVIIDVGKEVSQVYAIFAFLMLLYLIQINFVLKNKLLVIL